MYLAELEIWPNIWCFQTTSSTTGNGSFESPLISKDSSPDPGLRRHGPRRRHHRRRRPRSSEEHVDEDDDDIEEDDSEEEDGEGEEDTPEHEMEYCDPCYCYGKCCLDIVASIFCVSLL